jgi:hypothetical protein
VWEVLKRIAGFSIDGKGLGGKTLRGKAEDLPKSQANGEIHSATTGKVDESLTNRLDWGIRRPQSSVAQFAEMGFTSSLALEYG